MDLLFKMGAYLSSPVIEKKSSDFANEILKCGDSSMQGWRSSQEVSFYYNSNKEIIFY